MKITLKNIKYSAFASQDTHCFQATVYIDGVKLFTASNDGHGGCDSYDAIKGGVAPKLVFARVAEVNNKLRASLPWTQYKDGKFSAVPVDTEGTVPQDLEKIVCDLVNEWHREKEVKRIIKRNVLALNSDGELVTFKLKVKNPTVAQVLAVCDQIERQGEHTVLNHLPVSQIADHFKSD